MGWGHEEACGYLADTVESRRNPVESLHCRRLHPVPDPHVQALLNASRERPKLMPAALVPRRPYGSDDVINAT